MSPGLQKTINSLLHTLDRLSLPVLTAESCTAGMLASALTSRPTAPTMLVGGVLVYTNPLKHRLLGVDRTILDTTTGPGEVSQECALAMARGVVERYGIVQDPALLEWESQSHEALGLSTTGYLNNGPKGRAGEVWVGCHWVWRGEVGCRAERLKLEDEAMEERDVEVAWRVRERLKGWAVEEAVGLALELARKLENGVRESEETRASG